MNRNQKIALGCGGAGCLGLIVVAIAGGLIYFFARSPRSTRDYNFNVSTNRNSNLNANTTNSNSSSPSDSTIANDDKHKLYYAAGLTGDAELIQRVLVKIGVLNEDFSHGAKYDAFVEEHATWAINNFDFIQSINTPEKARAYVNEHFPQ